MIDPIGQFKYESGYLHFTQEDHQIYQYKIKNEKLKNK